MGGGVPRVVWFIWPTDPQRVSARSVAQRLVQIKRPAHLVWNPITGQIIQSLSPTRAASGLPADLNRHGRVCVQIRVLGSVEEPFTESKLDGLDDILGWLDSWGVPRRWPAGPPLAYPGSVAVQTSRRLWARGGHFGNSQVPGSVEGDPGPIDVHRIVGGQEGSLAVPRPREEMDRGCTGERSVVNNSTVI
jgi:hypothetical protein